MSDYAVQFALSDANWDVELCRIIKDFWIIEVYNSKTP